MKVAAFANAGASHQMTMCAIGRELQRLDHEFVLLGTEYQGRQLTLPDIQFEKLGRTGQDPVERYYVRSKHENQVSLSATLEYMKSIAALWCEEAPELLDRSGVDFVLADQEEPGAATAAELARLPYASICSSLPLDEDSDVPPGFSPWDYASGTAARLRNRAGYSIRNVVVRGINSAINAYRRRAGLRVYRRPDDSFSTRAQITQLVQEFDYPRRAPSPALHYVGPFQRDALSHVDFPFHRLDGRPLVYASFGTTFGSRRVELRAIAEACATLPVQLVISLGGAEPCQEHAAFPGDPIVVRYAPQRELLSRAAVAITHAGLNTVLEALSAGVPLLAMPIAGDQFGVAARIVYRGAGLRLPSRQRSAQHVRTAVLSLLHEPRWTAAARGLQSAIGETRGAAQAAEIIEAVGYSTMTMRRLTLA